MQICSRKAIKARVAMSKKLKDKIWPKVVSKRSMKMKKLPIGDKIFKKN
jgi:hypothetical protein